MRSMNRRLRKATQADGFTLLELLVAMGLTAGAGTGDWSLLGELTVAALVYSPALLVILGLAAALYGLNPRLLGLASAVLAFSGLAAFFGDMMELPTAAPLLLQLAVVAALSAIGIWAFGRRDLRSV